MTLIVRFNAGCKNVTFLSAEKAFIINKMFSPNLFFSGRLFISDSVCHKNHQLSYKCRQLKNAGKIHSMWFSNNFVNVELSERSQPKKIHHVIDIEKLRGVDNLDKFIKMTSF